MELKFQSQKKFKLWEYRVSHQSLLIRSPKESGGNTDLVFLGVESVNISTSLNGVEVYICADIDSKEAYGLTDVGASVKLYVVRSNGFDGHIAATFFNSEENELGLFDSPFL